MKVKLLVLVCLLAVLFMAVGCAATKAPKVAAPAGYESLRIVGGSLGGRTTTGAMTYATIFSKY